MKHAARVAKFGIVVGEDEVISGHFEIKNFATGESAPLEIQLLFSLRAYGKMTS